MHIPHWNLISDSLAYVVITEWGMSIAQISSIGSGLKDWIQINIY